MSPFLENISFLNGEISKEINKQRKFLSAEDSSILISWAHLSAIFTNSLTQFSHLFIAPREHYPVLIFMLKVSTSHKPFSTFSLSLSLKLLKWS